MKSKEIEQLEKETDALVSVLNDFCEKNGMDMLVCIGKKNTDVGFASFIGKPNNVIPTLCAAATDNAFVYCTVTTAAELLELTRKQGFDFEGVHKGTTTPAEQFRKIETKNANGNGNRT